MNNAFILFVVLAFCQQPPGGTVDSPDAGSHTLPPLPVTVTAAPSEDLPIGHDIEFTATHPDVLNPVYSWFARAGQCPERAMVGVDGNWTGPYGTECVGAAGTQEYKCRVSHDSPDCVEGIGRVTVSFHAPNEYNLVVGASQHFPETNTTSNTAEMTLLWDGQPIGPCAIVCAQENWRFVSRHARARHLDGVRLPHPKSTAGGWWPECDCDGQPYGGCGNGNFSDGRIPSGDTWNWSSPVLADVYWTFDIDCTGLREGEVLGSKTHKYRFTGPKLCGSKLWKYEIRLTFVLVVDANLQPVWQLR